MNNCKFYAIVGVATIIVALQGPSLATDIVRCHRIKANIAEMRTAPENRNNVFAQAGIELASAMIDNGKCSWVP